MSLATRLQRYLRFVFLPLLRRAWWSFIEALDQDERPEGKAW